MIVIAHKEPTNLVEGISPEGVVGGRCPTYTLIPQSEAEMDALFEILASKGWIKDTRKAEPAAEPDPEKVNPDERFKVGCHYKSNTGMVFIASEKEAGKLIWPHMHHNPACPQCHPVKGEPIIVTPGVRVSLEDVIKSTDLYATLPDSRVRIMSGEGHTYWKPDAAGYTHERGYAGIYNFLDAWKRSAHAGPEKKVVYEVVEYPATKPLAVGDRFRVSDVQADPGLRKMLEGCIVNMWSSESENYYVNASGAEWSDGRKGSGSKNRDKALKMRLKDFELLYGLATERLKPFILIEIASLSEPKPSSSTATSASTAICQAHKTTAGVDLSEIVFRKAKPEDFSKLNPTPQEAGTKKKRKRTI